MPRLPRVRDITHVSINRLRLPALNMPAPDPISAALQNVGRSVGALGEAFDNFARRLRQHTVVEEKIKTQKFDPDQHKTHTISRPNMFFFKNTNKDRVNGEGRSSDCSAVLLMEKHRTPLEQVRKVTISPSSRFRYVQREQDGKGDNRRQLHQQSSFQKFNFINYLSFKNACNLVIICEMRHIANMPIWSNSCR